MKLVTVGRKEDMLEKLGKEAVQSVRERAWWLSDQRPAYCKILAAGEK